MVEEFQGIWHCIAAVSWYGPYSRVDENLKFSLKYFACVCIEARSSAETKYESGRSIPVGLLHGGYFTVTIRHVEKSVR